jgi:hypothetical protein
MSYSKPSLTDKPERKVVERIVMWEDPQQLTSTERSIREAKSKVCRELEKVCPTDKSLVRMVKEMHDIFDKLEGDITIINANT